MKVKIATIRTRHTSTASGAGRIVATNNVTGQQATLPYDHAVSADRNHLKAAAALGKRLGWKHNDALGYRSLANSNREFYNYSKNV